MEITSADVSNGEDNNDDDDEELTESSENIFLRNLSEIIANSEQTSANESLLSITEVKSVPQPQFGYFLPLSLTPTLRRLKRFFFSHPTQLTLYLFDDFFFFFCLHRETQAESSRSPTPMTQSSTTNHQQQQPQLNVNNHTSSSSTNGRSKRFSSPAYSDYGICDKVNSRNINGKIGKRNTRSMNEAIEVLADQVEEEYVVCR
jgi:hypothetical protein